MRDDQDYMGLTVVRIRHPAIFATKYAFAALKPDGHVVVWGAPFAGGQLPGTGPSGNWIPYDAVREQVSDVQHIFMRLWFMRLCGC